LAIVLSVLRFKAYDYPFGIFKLFLTNLCAIFFKSQELPIFLLLIKQIKINLLYKLGTIGSNSM
jgi:hypothetical protein